jgi:hypothetical protein
MQKNRIVGFSVVGLLAALGTTALAVGCSGDDVAPKPVVVPDSGTTDANVNDAPAPLDSGKDAGPKPVLAKIQIVHAAPVAGAVRICFATAPGAKVPSLLTDVAGLPPLPAAATGLPPGAGGSLPSTGTDLSNVTMTPVLFKVSALVREKTAQRPAPKPEFSCPELLNPAIPDAATAGSFVKDVDYFVLPNIAPGTFAYKSSVLVVAAGCPAGVAGSALPAELGGAATNCGSDYDPTKSNLRAITMQLDNTPAAAGKIKAQFLHASAAADVVVAAVIPPAGPEKTIRPFLVTGAAPKNYLAPAGLSFVPNSAAPTAAVEVSFDPATTKIGIEKSAVEYTPLTLAITSAERAATGAITPGYFAATKGYTFVAVGDPRVTFDPANPLVTGLATIHYLAMPNDPTIADFVAP